MGLLRFLLGFDRGDLARLEERVRFLEEENRALKEAIEGLARRLEELAVAPASMAGGSQDSGAHAYEERHDGAPVLDGGGSYSGEYEPGDAAGGIPEGVGEDAGYYDGEHQDGDTGDEEVVLAAIVSGVTSPSEIMEATGLSKHRVYAALKSLVEKGVIVKRREGRRVHYLPAEGIPEAATGSPGVEAPA